MSYPNQEEWKFQTMYIAKNVFFCQHAIFEVDLMTEITLNYPYIIAYVIRFFVRC